MLLTKEQHDQLHNLMNYRDEIVGSLFKIEQILKQYFPEEFDVAYQHWIPQILTALYEEKNWLPRGEFTMQQTINRLIDKSQDSNNKGVSRYI